MKKYQNHENAIPVSLSLQPTLQAEDMATSPTHHKNRVLLISALAIIVAIFISFISKFLVYLIYLVTNLSFYGKWSFAHWSPASNSLGFFVIMIPALGGLIVGLIAIYGSEAIRGHGIPEAMEQILTNQSKIKPTITYLKPISSAIAIGTGGPFGTEGPIIATGGALGSMLGQLVHITHHERKILLAAGATAGMAAIFGTPVSAIFLAIELLLFEFSPRSIIPVSLACITGAAGHHLLFGTVPVFATAALIPAPSNIAIAIYSCMGIVIGFLSIGVTRVVYLIEDAFEKLPVHWMWWPAIGGLAVGIIGYFSPRTLGVGYSNITDILAGSLGMHFVLSLCLLKFISWAIALGSGSSGGTLAPLLTIGGATGTLLAASVLYFFPSAGLSMPLAALVGMAALFAGASRAFITSVIFALESTGQPNALLPLLATCGASFIISYFFMGSTIMTEKISRRGVKTPDSFEADILETVSVGEVMQKNGLVLSEDTPIREVLDWLEKEPEYKNNYFIVSDTGGTYKGIVSSSSLYNKVNHSDMLTGALIRRKNASVAATASLRDAVELMAKENVDVVPVVSVNNKITGLLSYQNIIASYKTRAEEHEKKGPDISIKRSGLKMLVKGHKLIKNWRTIW